MRIVNILNIVRSPHVDIDFASDEVLAELEAAYAGLAGNPAPNWCDSSSSARECLEAIRSEIERRRRLAES